MKRLFFLAAAALFFSTAHAQKPGALIDVTHYEFGLTLTDADNNIQGNATVEFSVLKETKSITLDLISKKQNGKGMTVIAVKEKDQSLPFNHNNDVLIIDLPCKPGDKKALTIQYEGIPADGLIITNNKYKHRGFFA